VRRSAVIALLAGAVLGCDNTPPPRIPDPALEGMEQRVAELLRESRKAVVAAPYSAADWGALGAAYQAHRLLAEADRCYERANELDGDDFRWVYLRAIAREIAGAGADELERLFDEAVRLRPDYTAAHVRLGDAMSSRGRLREARAAFEAALALDGQLALAHRGLGQVLLALGEVGPAVAALERAIEIDPADGSAWAALARARNRAGDPAAATEAAGSARRLGDSAGAMADPVFEEEIVARGASGTRALSRAVQKVRAGDLHGALEDLRLADETHPNDSAVQNWLGIVHRGLEQPAEAIEHLRRAVELNPALRDARIDLGRLLEDDGRPAEALPHYEAVLESDPDHAGVWFALARCRFQTGDRSGAVEGLQQVLRLAPDHAPARRLLDQLQGAP